MNRSIEATPYLCLAARLTQTIFNKALIAALMLIVAITSLYSRVEFELGNVQTYYTMLASATVQESAEYYNPQLVAQAALANTETAVALANDQASSSLKASFSTAQSLMINYMDIMTQMYYEGSNNTLNAAVVSAENSTSTIHTYIANQLATAINSTQDGIDSVVSAVEALESALTQSGVLLQNSTLGSVGDLSLAAFQDISVPQDINTTLLSMQQGQGPSSFGLFTSLGSSKLAQAATSLSDQLSSANSTLTLSMATYPLASNSTNDDKISTSNVITLFDNIQSDLARTYRTVMAVMASLAVAASLSIALYEYYAWGMLMQEVKLLEGAGQTPDVMANLNAGTNVITTVIGLRLTRFVRTERAQTMVRWWTSYVASPAAVFLVASSAFLTVFYICELGVIDVIASNGASKITNIYVSSASDTAWGAWCSTVNDALATAESSFNQQLRNASKAVLEQTAGIISEYNSNMTSSQSTFFAGTDLLTNSSALPALIENLSYAIVQYPRLNATILSRGISSLSTDSATTDSAVITLQQLVHHLSSVAKVHIQVSMSFFGFWLAILVGAAIYAYFKSRHS